MCGGMRNKEWLGSFCIESTLSCMCAEGLLFASIDRKVILLALSFTRPLKSEKWLVWWFFVGCMVSQISARLMS